MVDVQLEVIDLSTGQTVGTFSLTICTPQAYELDIGSYQFKATYLPTGEVQTQSVSIIEGTNPQLDFTFTPVVVPPPSGDYDYTLDVNQAGAFIVKDVNGTTVHTDASIILAIQWMANVAAPSNKKCLVKNLGQRDSNITQTSPSGLARIFNLTQGMNLDLETGLIIHNTNPTNWGLLSFDGRFSGDNQRNGCLIQGIGGRVAILGAGDTVGGEKGVYIRQGSKITLRNLEIGKTGSMAVNMDADAGGETPAYNDHNTFEDIYIHEWAQGPYTALGFGIDGSYNIVRRCIMDGMHSGNTRSAMYIGAETSPSHDNLVEDCEFLNTRYDNGVYLNSWNPGQGFVVHDNIFRRIHCAGNQAGGHSGFKCRPASYNIVEDLLSELNEYGIDNGTGPLGLGMGDDGHGHPNDGWCRGNRFIRGIIRSNIKVGIVLTVDYDNTGVEQNYYDLYLFQNPTGIWFCNYSGGDGGSGFIQDNIFFITIDRSTRHGMQLSAHGAVNAYSQRNHFIGIIKDSADAVYIDDPGVMDNYFDLVISNCGATPIIDNGTRNRWNGVGKYAYGLSITPPSSDWNDGDIVINTSDNTSWIRLSGNMVRLNVGQAIPQLTYMERKGGLPAGTAQFIDKSFVSGRTITSWLWDFGDGTATSTLQHPVHVYATKGTYNVTLTVTDNLGNKTTTVQSVDVTEEVHRTLTILPTSNGSTNPASGNYLIADGQTQSVFFSPATGYVLDHWELDGVNIGLQNPIPILMYADHTVGAFSRLIPPEKGTLQVHTFLDDTEVVTQVEIVGIGSYGTPLTIDLDPSVYTLNCTYLGQTQTKTATILAGQVVTVEFRFISPTPITSAILPAGIAILSVAGLVYYLATRKKR